MADGGAESVGNFFFTVIENILFLIDKLLKSFISSHRRVPNVFVSSRNHEQNVIKARCHTRFQQLALI